jgi:predicted GIY-YIG superfamily endonuclease
VVHTEMLPDKSAAYRREREVKGWKKRDRIEALIGAAR